MRDTGYSEDWYEDRLARQAGTKAKTSIANIKDTRRPEARTDNLERIPTIRKLDFQIPVKIISEANQREHWALKFKRKKDQQLETLVAIHNNISTCRVAMPCVVRLTRIGPKALDTDNLAGAFKHVQDAIARKLGVDDGDTTKVRWEYHQMPIRIRDYAVKVEIRST